MDGHRPALSEFIKVRPAEEFIMLGWNGTPWWMIFALLDEEQRNRDAPEPKPDVEALHTRWRKIKIRQYRRFKNQNKELLEKIEELNRHP